MLFIFFRYRQHWVSSEPPRCACYRTQQPHPRPRLLTQHRSVGVSPPVPGPSTTQPATPAPAPEFSALTIENIDGTVSFSSIVLYRVKCTSFEYIAFIYSI